MDAQADIVVKLYGLFAEAAGQSEFKVCTPDPSSVRDILNTLSETLGEDFERLLLNEDGGIQEDVVVLLNNRILSLNDLGTHLGKGDELSFIKAISGG